MQRGLTCLGDVGITLLRDSSIPVCGLKLSRSVFSVHGYLVHFVTPFSFLKLNECLLNQKIGQDRGNRHGADRRDLPFECPSELAAG